MSDGCKDLCNVSLTFPKAMANRPSLSRLDYRVGTYSAIRKYIMRGIDTNPYLAGWTHREPDDPGIALLEGACVIGDIISQYQDLYANEAFLRTADWRESVSRLVRLLGYRLSPSLGGRATFALEVSGDDPVEVPAGLPLKAQLQETGGIANFGTEESLQARKTFNEFHLYRPSRVEKVSSDDSVLSIMTSALEDVTIQPSDRLLLREQSGAASHFQVAVVDSVEEVGGRTEVSLVGSWKGPSVDHVTAYKIGRSFRHFGYNAPTKTTTITNDVASQSSTSFTTSINAKLFLDAEYDDLTAGALVMITYVDPSTTDDEPNRHRLREISAAFSQSQAVGDMSGGCTTIKYNQITVEDVDLRTVVAHELASPSFKLTGKFVHKGTSNEITSLGFLGDEETWRQLDGRRLLLSKPGADAVEVVVYTGELPGADHAGEQPTGENVVLRELCLSGPPDGFNLDDFPLREQPTTTVFGNLVDATQGKYEGEVVLGNGDNRQIYQTFAIPKDPLTYLYNTEESPPEVPELEVYVDGIRWSRVDTFYGIAPDEKVYIVREDEASKSYVQFGSRLSSGVSNVTAKYRSGSGAYGGIVPDTSVSIGQRVDGLDKAYMPSVASGGAEAESGENARDAAPGKVQSLDRLVSLRDFELETLAIAGVSRTSADWAVIDGVPVVAITVLMATGRDAEFAAVEDMIVAANRSRGADRHAIVATQAAVRYAYVGLEYGLHPDLVADNVEAEIRSELGVCTTTAAATGGLFGEDQRTFGELEFRTRIEATVQSVHGVVWAKATALGTFSSGTDPSDSGFPETPSKAEKISCNSNELLALCDSHLSLRAIAQTTAGAC